MLLLLVRSSLCRCQSKKEEKKKKKKKNLIRSLKAFVAVCFGLFGALGDGPRAAETPLNFQKDALKIIDVNGHDLDASLSLAVYDVSDGVRKGGFFLFVLVFFFFFFFFFFFDFFFLIFFFF
jgi:hypothetical protein